MMKGRIRSFGLTAAEGAVAYLTHGTVINCFPLGNCDQTLSKLSDKTDAWIDLCDDRGRL